MQKRVKMELFYIEMIGHDGPSVQLISSLVFVDHNNKIDILIRYYRNVALFTAVQLLVP